MSSHLGNRDSAHFNRMHELLLANPPSSLEEAMAVTIPALFSGLPTATVHRRGNEWVYDWLTEPNTCLYWDGSKLIERIVGPSRNVCEDFASLSAKILELAPDMVVDLGAGSCILAVALRAAGFAGRSMHVERNADALKVGQALVKMLSLQSTELVVGDFTEMSIKPHGVTVVVTRGSLHPFLPNDKAEELARAFCKEGISAGFHLELTGYHTDTYKQLAQQLHLPKIRSDHATLNDPLQAIASKTLVRERIEMWPQVISTQTWSYLSWERPKTLLPILM